MKMALLAAAAMFATPLVAQTTMNNPSSSPVNPVDTTAQQTPATTPPQTDPSMAQPAPMAPAAPMATPAPGMADAPPPAATGKLPWCRPGQYTACRERETRGGEGLRKN